MKYLILTESSSIKLGEKVETALALGWELQGGVSMAIQTGLYAYTEYAQAMILPTQIDVKGKTNIVS